MNFAAGDTSCNTEKQIAGTERLGFVATFREQVWFQLAGTGPRPGELGHLEPPRSGMRTEE